MTPHATFSAQEKFWKALVMPALLVVFASYLVFGIVTMQVPKGAAFPGPRFFPAIITVMLYLLSALIVLSALRNRRQEKLILAGTPAVEPRNEPRQNASPASPASTAADETSATAARGFDVPSLLWVIGSFLGFALLLNFLGWIIAAGLLFWGVAWGFGSKRWLSNLIVGLSVSSAAYIAFDMSLGLSLPSGLLGGGF